MADKFFPDIDSNPYFLEKNRLETFKKWPFGAGDACNPQKMAEAGWYAVNYDDVFDVAKCMVCDKELDGWEDSDDPWTEHSKRCPKCPFIIVNKKQSEWKLSDYLIFSREFAVSQVGKEFDEKSKRMGELFEAYVSKKLGTHIKKSKRTRD